MAQRQEARRRAARPRRHGCARGGCRAGRLERFAVFYPQLRRRADPGGGETRDAVRDHNKIRGAIADAARHPVGSDAWFEAVGRARAENSDHLKEEEDEALPDFRKHASLELRERLGVEWLRFKAEHPAGQGVSGETVDVEGYMKRTEP